MTYADTYNLRTTSATLNGVANAVDGLLIPTGAATSTSSVSTASTSYVDFTGMAVAVTVASGQRVLVIAAVSVSAGVANDQITLRFTRGGTAIGTEIAVSPGRVSTSGLDHCATLVAIDTGPSVGSNTYKVQWVNSTAANTIYSIRAMMSVVVFQNS